MVLRNEASHCIMNGSFLICSRVNTLRLTSTKIKPSIQTVQLYTLFFFFFNDPPTPELSPLPPPAPLPIPPGDGRARPRPRLPPDVVDALPGSERVPQRALKDEPLQEEPVLVVDRVIEPEPLDRGAHA